MRESLEFGVRSSEFGVQSEDKPRFSQQLQEIAGTRSAPRSAACLLSEAVVALTVHGISNSHLDVEVLLAHTLGTDRAGLYARLHDPLPRAQAEAFHRLIQRRARHEPLQYITGVQEFWSLEFTVDPRVLIPRPETEVVVEVALRLLARDLAERDQSTRPALHAPRSPAPRPGGLRLLDVGTGSGCLAITLATELPQAEIWATDVSADALAVARENARRHGVAGRIRFLRGDLFTAVARDTDGFHLIVSNPPYIAHHDLDTLQPEVRNWEPCDALDGGIDGLDFYRCLLSEGLPYLRSGGWLVMEIGQGQSPEIMRLVRERRDLSEGLCVRDYAGHERVVVAYKVETRVG
ncbi:MAG: peptide chain release factor N(5)-glutamine methyltransferase [Deltaproteobacteria bacterium]|nr:peptide chain release factor N(5)-glutamine methyltransferase [Deltaproteobacteria bacterium]